ncbi:hypothetical protein G3N55_09010 [Dissulfurirhabdus thermomarina]|uniref:Porin n=1 Tax=Dissulfurirhabdus thermomarina TaxID=1765737 RepID=A0A6N9TPK4_DISTH|nr:hypothetical protein [Dissulfurirhabdus thermomarina]NDY42978.1 hypothetical protein [Dissulfurirhabdus thermomarina]NMX23795.1 hypothetical protein [Dissulfurirhabdus thermomarina]
MKVIETAQRYLVAFMAVAFAAAVVAAGGVARAADDPLLQTLVKKGVLTPEEARAIAKENGREAGLPPALQGLSIGLLGYLDYSIGKSPKAGGEESFDRFTLGRGYLTVKKRITPWLSARITSDITRKADGDWEFRLKYLYAEFRPGDLGFLTDMKAEFGQGHNPWLDFEEHVNPYRCQGTMAIERAGVFNSADLGVSLRGNIGGKLPDAKEKTGNHHYDGLYGSWQVGVYNGGGYHADEANQNKAVEVRLTARPLPWLLPGFQLSYLGMFGEGNKDYNGDKPDYMVNLGMLSYEHPLFIFTAQYFQTTGNAAGSWVKTDALGNLVDELQTQGYSFFGRVRLPFVTNRLSLFGRYDHFDQDNDDDIAKDTAYDLYIVGLSFDVAKGNLLVLDYETTNYDDDTGLKHKLPATGTKLGDDYKVQLVYQLAF